MPVVSEIKLELIDHATPMVKNCLDMARNAGVELPLPPLPEHVFVYSCLSSAGRSAQARIYPSTDLCSWAQEVTRLVIEQRELLAGRQKPFEDVLAVLRAADSVDGRTGPPARRTFKRTLRLVFGIRDPG